MFSDGHALLEYNVKCRSSVSTAAYSQCAKNSTAGKPIPKASLADEFNMNIKDEDILSLSNLIQNCLNGDSYTQINDLYSNLSDIILKSAHNTFKTNSKPVNNAYRASNNKNNKPWYGPDCKKAKKVYNKAQKRYSKYPTLENLELKKTASLKYKKNNEPIH